MAIFWLKALAVAASAGLAWLVSQSFGSKGVRVDGRKAAS
jgi:hypothetical protein